MSAVPEALLEQALTLSPADRAKLASGLLARLDEDRVAVGQVDEAETERLWSAETDPVRLKAERRKPLLTRSFWFGWWATWDSNPEPAD